MSVIPRSLLPRLLGALCAGLCLAVTATAQSNGPLHTGHSIPGFYGFESNVRPPMGVSYENVTLFYNAEKETDRNGNDTGSSGSVRHFSNHTTISWLSPWRIFGANYVARARLAFVNSAPNPRALSASNRGFKLGDTYLEPLALYWLGDNGYLSLRYGLWVDSGDFEALSSSSAGKGFLTHQFSLGGTYYPHEDRIWHISLLGRLGFHGKVDGLDLRPGDDIVIDWSVGRRYGERWNAGLVGYGVFQTSRDQGADANQALGFYGNAGFGLGAKYELPSIEGAAELRLYQEFNSYNHTEGQTAAFGLTFRI